jgi:hypothetical protein
MPGILIHVISIILFPAALLSFTLLLNDFLRRRVFDGTVDGLVVLVTKSMLNG